MALSDNNKVNIYSSRERIRSELTDFIKRYSELEDVDLTKSSFVSYLIDVLSILTSNQIFYSSSIYREFFFTQARFPESVYNLANWIGYQPEPAEPSRVNVLFSFPTEFSTAEDNVRVSFPRGYQVKSGEIPFTLSVGNTDMMISSSDLPTDILTVDIIKNSSVIIKDSEGNTYPVQYNPENKNIQFILPFEQTDTVFESFIIPDDLEPYQFFDKEISFNGMYYDIEVFLLENTDGENLPGSLDEFEENSANYIQWFRSEGGIHTLDSNDPYYVWRPQRNKGTLVFGNGIIGKQPPSGSYVCVKIKTTQGYDGSIIQNQVSNADPLYYEQPGGTTRRLDFSVTNPSPSTRGSDDPTLPEIKSKAISNLKTRDKLVSNGDYEDFNLISPNVPIINTTPILKRSDLKVNDITLFASLLFHDTNNEPELVPTKNMNVGVPKLDPIDSRSTIIDRETGDEFQNIFSIQPDKETFSCTYEYIINEIDVGLESGERGITEFDRRSTITCNTATFKSEENKLVPGNYKLKIDINASTLQGDVSNAEGWDSKDNRPYFASLITGWDGTEYSYNIDSTSEYPIVKKEDNGQVSGFIFYLDTITKVPQGEAKFYFDIYGQFSDEELVEILNLDSISDSTNYSNIQKLRRYIATITVRKSLEYMMISQVTTNFSVNGTSLEPNKIYEDVNGNQWLVSSLADSLNSSKDIAKIIPYSATSKPEIGPWVSPFSDSTAIISSWEESEYNTVSDTSSQLISYIIHDVPTLYSNYLDVGKNPKKRRKDFEYYVLQNLINNFDVEQQKMATDFINVKPADTAGKLTNLKLNPSDRLVEQRSIPSDYNTSENIGKVYIVNGNEDIGIDNLIEKRHYFAKVSYSKTLLFSEPLIDQIIYVKDENKKYIFTGKKWTEPKFNIPLDVEAIIQKERSASISNEALIEKVKNQILEDFPHGFDKDIDRSKLIRTIRSVDGVIYCELKKPEINLKFNYSTRDLSMKELFNYTPQIVAITYDSINIRVRS